MDAKGFILIAALLAFFIYLAISSRSSRFSRSTSGTFHHSTLVSVLLHLPDAAVDELMKLYKEEFGKGPARYARKTLKKWRSGHVRPATQTFQRFLVHLPSVMSFDLKCEVLRHFMQEFGAKDNYELDVYTDDWEQKLTPLVQQIIDKAYTAQLPKQIERKLKWLGDGDMQAAQNILRASQAEESRIMVSNFRDEFRNLETVLAHDNLKTRVIHVLRFPYGTIELNVKRR